MSRTPHDDFFEAIFSDPAQARSYLEQAVPRSILAQLDLAELRLESGSYVDRRLRRRHSDLLFTTRFRDGPLLIYLLLEHQSSVDPLMPFRLLRYMVRVWERWLEEQPGVHSLPPILPLVLFHGPGGWTGPTTLRDLLRVPPGSWTPLAPYCPDFSLVLWDLSAIPDAHLKGTALVELALLLLKHIHAPDLLPRLRSWGRLLREVWGRSGWQAMCQVVEYLREAGEHVELDDLVELFETEVEPAAGREIMTLTQKLLAQGRAEGRMEGRVEGKAGLLLRLLAVRFRTIPDPVRQRVSQATPEELDGWAERILFSTTLEEVFGN